jgi:hypothetical protein
VSPAFVPILTIIRNRNPMSPGGFSRAGVVMLRLSSLGFAVAVLLAILASVGTVQVRIALPTADLRGEIQALVTTVRR